MCDWSVLGRRSGSVKVWKQESVAGGLVWMSCWVYDWGSVSGDEAEKRETTVGWRLGRGPYSVSRRMSLEAFEES